MEHLTVTQVNDYVDGELTAAEREALASYLVINGGIPIDLVPEELRAGGASY